MRARFDRTDQIYNVQSRFPVYARSRRRYRRKRTLRLVPFDNIGQNRLILAPTSGTFKVGYSEKCNRLG